MVVHAQRLGQAVQLVAGLKPLDESAAAQARDGLVFHSEPGEVGPAGSCLDDFVLGARYLAMRYFPRSYC